MKQSVRLGILASAIGLVVGPISAFMVISNARADNSGGCTQSEISPKCRGYLNQPGGVDACETCMADECKAACPDAKSANSCASANNPCALDVVVDPGTPVGPPNTP